MTTSEFTTRWQRPTLDGVRQLLEAARESERPWISAFIRSPKNSGFADLKKLHLVLQSVVDESRAALAALPDEAAAGVDPEVMLAPLEELSARIKESDTVPEDMPPTPFTLVYHLSPDPSFSWHLATELEGIGAPPVPSTAVGVSRSPRIVPLLQGMKANQRFRVLLLSNKRVELLEGDAGGLDAVDQGGIPGNLVEALGAELEKPEGHQQHSAGRAPTPGAAASTAMHHGQGGASAERDVDQERFHRVVAKAVESRLASEPECPLLLFADQSHQGEFRKHHDLPGLVEAPLNGTPDSLSNAEVHAKAWAMIEEHLDDSDSKVGSTLEAARNGGRGFETDPAALAELAVAGRLERIWISTAARHEGRIDMGTGRIDGGWPGENALDQLAGLVLTFGGEVHVLDSKDSPADTGVAGILRS